MVFLEGAQYERDGTLYRLLGARGRTLVFRAEGSGEIREEPNADLEKFTETGVHDHVDHCCSVHNLHVSPHRGCIFR